jgi:transport and Golgi organization protein 2
VFTVMCTLILGRDVLGAGTVVLAANRDEDPARPTDPPRVLHERPRVVGGRDRTAGGTWLAVRPEAAVALLNRKPAPGVPTTVPPAGGASPVAPRSRGLLALEVAALPVPSGVLLRAAAGQWLAHSARAHALGALRAAHYSPLSRVFATARCVWLLVWDGARATVEDVAPGWHVLTHAALDDPHEPRTQRLLRELDGWTPEDLDAARRGLTSRLAAHDAPPVCIHEGRMQTVSHAFVFLGEAGVRYLHGEGRPCERAALDHTELVGEWSLDA